MTSLLDVLKETDLRVHFTQCFPGMGTRTMLDRDTLQRRLLLCLFGMGTNTGLKRVCTTMTGDQFHELLYIRRRYLHPDALRNAIAHVANAIFRFCLPHASLRQPLPQPEPTNGRGSAKRWRSCAPAMAAGLTDHVWSLREVLLFRVPPWPQFQGL